jgi:hypothetical protein
MQRDMNEATERVTLVVRRERLTEKLCPVCECTFVGLTRQRYCGRSCQNRADYQRHAEARRSRQRDRDRSYQEHAPRPRETIDAQPRGGSAGCEAARLGEDSQREAPRSC